jgi:hypothetical protein
MNLFNILDQITPKGTYFGLKLSKLLSLVNQKLNVIAVGQETITINNLFIYSLNLFSNNSFTCINHNAHLNDLFYSFKTDTNGLNFVQAGSLILAGNKGVCYLNNILSYSKKEIQTLKDCFENKRILIQKKTNQKSLNDAFLANIEYSNINCSVWTYYDSSYNTKDKNIHDTYLLPNPLIEYY